MNKEEISYYLEHNIKIKIVLKNNFRYTGKIIKLFPSSLQFEDRFAGVVVIPYEEIRVITEVKDGN